MPDGVRYVTAGDADRSALDGQRVAVVGYGNVGRSLALNLRDAGVDVHVANRDDEFRQLAVEEGFAATDLDEAVAAADIAWVLVPDEELPRVFASVIGPALRPGAAVAFASGYGLAFGLVDPPPEVDVLLVAPRMPGDEVRRSVVEGDGFVSYVGVERDASGRAWPRLLALAHAAGGLAGGAMVLSARDEARLDLFVEQTFGTWLGAAIQAAFAVGVEGGLPPEALVVELYQSGELARTVAGFARDGFYRSAAGHGATALIGGFLRLNDTDPSGLAERFRAILGDIDDGSFARAFQAEQEAGGPTLAVIRQMVDGSDAQSAAEDRVRRGLRRDS